MTIAVDLGCKATKQTTNENLCFCSLDPIIQHYFVFTIQTGDLLNRIKKSRDPEKYILSEHDLEMPQSQTNMWCREKETPEHIKTTKTHLQNESDQLIEVIAKLEWGQRTISLITKPQ